jgi:protein TonB
MLTTRATRRKVKRAFRVTRRRTLSPPKASLSSALAAVPVVARVSVSRDKTPTKSTSGIALATSLVIHAGALLPCVLWGMASYAVPSPGTISVDILMPTPAASPTLVKPIVVQAVVPSTRIRTRVWLSAKVPPTPPVRRAAQRVAELLPVQLALAAARAPDSTPEAPPIVRGASMPVRASGILPANAPALNPTVVEAAAIDATAGVEIARRLRTAAASCYPYAAIRSSLEGTTRLRFCIGAKGEPRDVQVVDSSGQQVLDRAATDCVLPSAAPFPATSHLCVTVPVRFELRK